MSLLYLKIMILLGRVDLETALIDLVSHTVPHHLSEHHLGAVHEVDHDILQLWHQSRGVDLEEVDFVIGGHLDPDISFSVVNQATNVFLMVLNPLLAFQVLVELELEEDDRTRAPSNQCLVVYQHHLTKIQVGHLVYCKGLWRLVIKYDGVTLAVKRVDLALILVVEAFERKVLFGRSFELH